MKTTFIVVFTTQIWLVASFASGFQTTQDDNAKNKSESKTLIKAVAVTTVVDEIAAGASGLTVDQQGNLYMGDGGPRWDGRERPQPGTKVFKIGPDGYVTLFSRETHGASGSAIDSEGNFFQASFLGNFITKFTLDGKVVGVVREGFDKPTGITIDENGLLFICNCWGNSIQKVTPDGKSTRFCKNSNLIDNPIGIAVCWNWCAWQY